MGLPDNIWARIKRGDYSETDAGILEVICSVGRQLAYRLEKLIDVLERGPEEPVIPIAGPGAYTPMGRLIAFMRLDLASYPRDHSVVAVTNAGSLIVSNPLFHSIPILITNLSNAQFLYYGSSSVAITNGPIIDPETSHKILLSPSADLYGIVLGANINVAVSNLDIPTV